MTQLRFRAAVIAVGAAVGVFSASSVLGKGPPHYDVVKSVSLGAPDRWDYVVFDPGSHRVYVAHGDRVTVVDGHDGTIVGQVEGFPGGTHGIGISARTGKGYTDDGRAGVIGAFDLKTLNAGTRIKGEEDADGIAFDLVTGHIFVANGDPASVTVVDPATDAVIATIDGGGKLEYAVADDRGRLYVNGADKKEIVRINTRTNKVDAHWSISNCTSPHGLAIDTEKHRLFSSCANNLLVVVNADNGAVIASLPIGAGSDAVAFDPKRKRVFSSNGRTGDLTVIEEQSADRYAVLGSIKTQVTARTMALDPDTGRLFIAGADVDATAQPTNGRPKLVPGSLKLLILDPTP
jgi:YVTN family beta-propeller protein